MILIKDVSSSHVRMWELDHKEGWMPRVHAFELWGWRRLLKVPWTARRSNQSILKEINREYSLTDAETEAPILWPSVVKSWLIGKDPDAGKDWGQKEKGTTEDEMVGWHHRLNGHEFEKTVGGGEGPGSLVCCSPWDHRESDTNEWLNNKMMLKWRDYPGLSGWALFSRVLKKGKRKGQS